MASAAPTADSASPPGAAAPKKSRKGLLIGVAVAVLAAGGGGAYFMLKPKADAAHGAPAAAGAHGAPSAHGEPGAAVGTSNYMALDPAFVVNLEDPDDARYLQVEIQVMTRESVALDLVKAHMPRIRNSLILLFGQQKTSDLATREGKEKLQAAALAEIQKVMQVETGKPVVEAAYFTSFVMQ